MRGIDREALLAALVIAPATYSRNRFFQLYTDPEMGRVRRRAAQIRSIVRHLARLDANQRGELVSVRVVAGGEGAGDEQVELTYTVPSLGLRRTAVLDAVEIALVRFALARKEPPGPDAGDPDRQRVEAALRRLAPALASEGAAGPVT